MDKNTISNRRRDSWVYNSVCSGFRTKLKINKVTQSQERKKEIRNDLLFRKSKDRSIVASTAMDTNRQHYLYEQDGVSNFDPLIKKLTKD